MKKLTPLLSVPSELAFKVATRLQGRVSGLRLRHVVVGPWPVAFYEGGPADRPTVVLVHGYTANKDVWTRFAGRLTKDFHVVIPDLPGHGQTGYQTEATYDIASQADFLAQFLSVLGVGQAHIAGNSMGGFIAATFAVHHPARTVSLSLFNPSGVVSPEPSELDAQLARGHNPFLMDSAADFEAFYPLTMARPPFLPRPLRAVTARDYLNRRHSYARIWDDIQASGHITEQLHQITAPTLIVWGDKDAILHVSGAEIWREIPGARVKLFHDVGHMPMLEVPGPAAAAYRDFVGSVSG